MMMKKMILLTLMLCGSMTYACGDDLADKGLVKKTLMSHLNGIKNGDYKRSAWDLKNGQVQFVEIKKGAPSLVTADLEKSLKLWTAKPSPKTSWTIQEVKILNENMATVKLNLTWKDTKLKEQITLSKIKGDWKIMSKIYTAEAKKASANPYVLK